MCLGLVYPYIKRVQKPSIVLVYESTKHSFVWNRKFIKYLAIGFFFFEFWIFFFWLDEIFFKLDLIKVFCNLIFSLSRYQLLSNWMYFFVYYLHLLIGRWLESENFWSNTSFIQHKRLLVNLQSKNWKWVKLRFSSLRHR